MTISLTEQINNTANKQNDIAKLYAMAIQQRDTVEIDWPVVNRAIISRWSKSGLKKIKRQAWMIINDPA